MKHILITIVLSLIVSSTYAGRIDKYINGNETDLEYFDNNNNVTRLEHYIGGVLAENELGWAVKRFIRFDNKVAHIYYDSEMNMKEVKLHNVPLHCIMVEYYIEGGRLFKYYDSNMKLVYIKKWLFI